MEFNCPTCRTKLRVSDELRNPKVRCRACGTVFQPLGDRAQQPGKLPESTPKENPFGSVGDPPARPVQSASTPPRDRSPSPIDSLPRPTRSARPVITPRSTSGRGKSGWGIGFFILLMVLSRVPRLLRNFEREPAPPPPVQIDDAEIRQRLQEALERAREMQDEGMAEFPESNELPDGAELPDGIELPEITD